MVASTVERLGNSFFTRPRVVESNRNNSGFGERESSQDHPEARIYEKNRIRGIKTNTDSKNIPLDLKMFFNSLMTMPDLDTVRAAILARGLILHEDCQGNFNLFTTDGDPLVTIQTF